MNRGSEWRVWDLHFHTPSSYDYKDKSVTNEQLVEGLVSHGVSVVAITDHYIIDVNRIKELQIIGREKGLTVFPGIEFCSELGGKQAVHFIAIFSPKADLESIWTKIQGQCNLTSADIEQKGGYESICCDFIPTCDLILNLGGIVTVHGGSKNNSLEEIKNNLLQKQELKRRLLSTYHPILDCGKPIDADNYHKIVFPSIGFTLPVIISSDNHDIKDYHVTCKTWIKADCTFSGLKQVLYEPNQRVLLSEGYPEIKNSYSVIDKIELQQDGVWNQCIYLNSGLNAIIGGRSTGKSNLLSCIAANLNHVEKTAYNNYVNSVKDSVKVVWMDNEVNKERKIDYLPQNFIYSLVDDKKELNNLLYGIMLSNQTLASNYVMYQAKCNDLKLRISNLLNRLLEQKRLLIAKKQEIHSIGDSKGIVNEIRNLTLQKENIEKQCALDPVFLKSYEEDNKKVHDYTRCIDELTVEIESLKRLSVSVFLVENQSVSYDGIREQTKSEIKAVVSDLLNRSNLDIHNKLVSLSANIVEQRNTFVQLRDRITSSDSYKNGKSLYEANVVLASLRKRLNEQEQLLTKVKGKNEEYKAMLVDFKEILSQLLDSYSSYLALTNEITVMMHIEHDDVKLSSSVIVVDKLNAVLSDSLNLKYKEMIELKDQLLNIYQLMSEEQLKSALEPIVYSAMRGDLKFKGSVDDSSFLTVLLTNNFFQSVINVEYDGDSLQMMSPGKRTFVILKLLLDFSRNENPILIDQPEDNLDNRAIYKELVMYIRKKKLERQIIIVTHNPNIVVGADAENVIVANQNGVRTPNVSGIKFQYKNGSLEDSFRDSDGNKPLLDSMGIREHVCEILEGGEEAFRKRESKYGFARI